MVTRDIIQRLLGIINDTRSRLNTLEAKEVALLTATQTLTNKTLTTPTIGDFTNAQHAHTNAASGGTISHNSLTDLTTGDPHTQYLLETTYDANTILKADSDNTPVALTVGASTIVGRAATGDIAALTAAQVATIVQGSIDHGSIAGLADDDHTGYARLAGRSGGQTLIGGTAANDDLTLEGTSNATRTTSYVVLQPNGGNVGIGTTSPGAKLHVNGAIRLPSTIWIETESSVNLIRETFFGYSSVYKVVQLGVSSTNRAISLGYNPSSNINGSFNGDEILIPNNKAIIAPTNADNAYVGVLKIDSSNNLRIGGADFTTAGHIFVNNTSGNVGIGTTSPDTRLDIDAGAIEFAEMTAPAAGAANTGRLFCRDNGSGKTQLCVIFNTGAIQVIATQP